MRIRLLARPDHSRILYNSLDQDENIKCDYFTFNVFKKRSFLHKLSPSVKTVSSEVNILYVFTFLHQVLKRFHRRFHFNWYKWESLISEVCFRISNNRSQDADIIHYWPVYCHRYVNQLRGKKNVKTVADVYAAHPAFMEKVLLGEYKKYNLDYTKSYFHIDADRNLEFLEHEDNVIVPSGFVADTYKEFFPEKNFYVCSFGNFANNDAQKILKQKKLKNDLLRIVYVGNISIEKGVHFLLNAIAGFNKDEVQLDLIGGVPVNQDFIFKDLLKQAHVKHIGRLTNDQVKAKLMNYDLFVLPSLGDAYSLAVQEALECGIPVIVTENTGNKADVEKYNLGDVVKVKDVEDLQLRITKYMDLDYLNTKIESIQLFMKKNPIEFYPNQVIKVYNNL